MKTNAPLTCLLLLLSTGLSAQTRPGAPGRVVTTTRLVSMFSDLEDQWLTAIQKKDAAALDRLLSDDFQVWTAEPPGAPLPHEDWQAQAFASKLQSFRIRQMAVRGVSDDVAIASFVLQTSAVLDGKEVPAQHFVVDVWKRDGESWHCTDRYLSEAKPPASKSVSEHPSGKQ
jgi:ketosteroid isomerase-like protein